MSILTPNLRPISRYQPRARELPPLPPSWRPPAMWERRRDDGTWWRFVLLSMLLHALGILLFGAPSGGSREGRALWGSIDVEIRDSFRERGPSLRFDRELQAPRATPPAPPAAAPKVSPVPKPDTPRAGEAVRKEPEPAPMPPVLDRLERRLEVPPFEVPKVPDLAEPPKIDVAPAPPRPIEAPRLDAIPTPRLERQLVEPPRIEAPIVQPVPLIETPKLDRVDAPRVERQLAEPPKIEAPIVQPIETPVIPAPRVERPAAPAPSPREVPPAPTAPAVEQPPPAPTPRAPATPAPPPASTTPAAPPATAAPATRAPAPKVERESAPLEQAPSPFRSAPSRTPDASTYDPTAPALDLDALRKRAGELTRQGTGNRAALPFPMPPVEKPKTKIEDALEKARKPDCRTAYQSLGLAAVVPLIANEFGEGNCRW